MLVDNAANRCTGAKLKQTGLDVPRHISLHELILNGLGCFREYIIWRGEQALGVTYPNHCPYIYQKLLFILYKPQFLLGFEIKLTHFLKYFINAGNKIDLADKREVSQQRAAEFSEAQDMYYLETSAKESDNVEKLFLDLACRLISEARQNTLVNNVSSPLPGEGKSISYLTCCNFN